MKIDNSMKELNLIIPDVRELVRERLPILFEFIPETNRTWGKANKLFRAEVEKRYSETQGDIMIVEANLYYIIRRVQQGDLQASRMVHFFQRLLEEATMYINKKDHEKIRKNIQDILLHVDLRYLNFFAEIAVLNNLMKTGTYTLVAVEAKLQDSRKTIDFAIRNKENNNELLVEVVSIHPDSDKIENVPDKIEKYLSGKIREKINSKETQTPFYLIPVIWATSKDLRIYSEFLRNHQLQIPGLIEPAAYSTFVSPEDGSVFIHRFGRLTTLFTDEFGGMFSTDYK